MRTNEILTTIPSIPHGASPNAPPDTALEIAVETAQQDGQNEQEDGQPSIALRRLTWGSGLGWCRQQTLTLTPAEAEAVLRALQKSRRKWQGESATPQGKVIPFPG